MIDYASTIAAIEADLAEMDRRRPLLERTLEGLRYLAGEAAPRVVTPRKAPTAAKTNKQTNKRTNERKGRASAARAMTPRSLPDEAGHQTRILAALIGGPMAPGELAAAVKLTVPNLRYQVNKLLERRAVVATGNTGNRRIALPGKEAP